MQYKKQIIGFTLIELMVAISIVSILATLAFPSFRNALAKGDRATAVADINDIAQSLERFYTFNRSYTNNFGNISMGTATSHAITGSEGLYDYLIIIDPGSRNVPSSADTADKTGQAYIIFAKPTGANRDNWVLSQDETGRQQYFDESALSSPIEGWP